MATYGTDDIRNVLLAGYGGSRKTTLGECDVVLRRESDPAQHKSTGAGINTKKPRFADDESAGASSTCCVVQFPEVAAIEPWGSSPHNCHVAEIFIFAQDYKVVRHSVSPECLVGGCVEAQ